MAKTMSTSGASPVTGTRDWADFSQPLIAPTLQAVLSCFVEYGYHGSTMRQLASSANLSVPGLYHHYDSKQAMLVELMQIAMSDLYQRSIAALADAGASVQDRLQRHVECLVLFHANRGDLAFLATSEIRSLEGKARESHIAARDRQQLILEGIVKEGVAAGLFRAENPHDTTRAIVTMCTGVSQWYRLGGPLSPSSLAQRYVVLVQRTLGQPV